MIVLYLEYVSDDIEKWDDFIIYDWKFVVDWGSGWIFYKFDGVWEVIFDIIWIRFFNFI